ncbi:RNA-binding protein [uncultured Methylovirgula sp.]|uniref:RNA-binding protein n=1 Tax=uncultured Methylovirgula sp. TaxID=1285960 RepID=UPI00261F2C49|nr:RNA-binding protein [uncultured Methylovirgula sp.]
MGRDSKAELQSERTCIVTRAKGAPESLLRFVRAPDGAVVPDLRHRLPGRGVWVTADAKTVAQAVKRKAFARGFKAEVKVSEALPDEVAALMQRDCLQTLSLAKKAGLSVSGFAKVEAAAQAGTMAALINASDGSADGSRKLRQALRRAALEVPEINLFTEAQLSLALGGANVVHAALTRGTLAESFLSQCRRLELYLSPVANAETLAEGGFSAPADTSMR